MTYHPNSELVTAAWLAGIDGLTSDMVGTELPASNNASLAASAYIQVKALPGPANIYVPQRTPTLQLDFWALAPDSGRPPWHRAWHYAGVVYAAILDHPNVPRAVTLPASYNGAAVQSVWAPNEPYVTPGDQGAFARIGLDITVAWVEI